MSGVAPTQSAATSMEQDNRTEVVIKGVHIGFFNLMWLLVKIALASLPAAIIVTIAYVFISGTVLGLFTRGVGRIEEARMRKAKEDVKAIEEAAMLFKIDNGFYPTTAEGLAAGTDPRGPHGEEE